MVIAVALIWQAKSANNMSLVLLLDPILKSQFKYILLEKSAENNAKTKVNQ